MLWVKTFHIVMVTSWFAGLFYLPRIYVNLAQETNEQAHERLLGMAARLYRFMTPLAALAIALGLWLLFGYGLGSGQGWMHAKLTAVIVLIVYHLQCGRVLRTFQARNNTRSHRYYRWFNEIPVLLLLLITALVIVRPF